MLGVSLGIVFISYVLQMLSTLSTSTKFLKYFSVFTLADIRNVILNVALNPFLILISVGLSFLLIVFILLRYNKKEFV